MIRTDRTDDFHSASEKLQKQQNIPRRCPNGRATRGALVQAGASEWSIYTRDELRTLYEQNRVAPLSPAELRKVHEIKRTFSRRITT
jgi:hypothetical protein